MKLTFLLLVITFILPIIAMHKNKATMPNVLDSSDSEWVTVMVTAEDGVLIGSDPDSAGELPPIQMSYCLNLAHKKERQSKTYKVIETEECIKKIFVKTADLSQLIIEYSESKRSERCKEICLPLYQIK